MTTPDICTDRWPRRTILGLLAAGAGLALFPRSLWASQRPPVLSGLEVALRDHIPALAGNRIGLVCNHTAVDRAGTHAIDLLRAIPDIRLQALFTPEHGLRGRIVGGKIADSTDPISGLPIRSLYGDHRKPSPAMLKDIDLLVIDLQDVGARFYTYWSTMALVMQAAGEHGLPVWVLDRPNPIGGSQVQGPQLDPKHASFLGYYPVPVRHGLTMGELARYIQGSYGVQCDLTVIPLEGWRRPHHWEDIGWPWVPPSPSLWRPEATLTYPGMCLFEGTNCSLGGSTFHPYEVVAAPWMDSAAIAAAAESDGWPGLHFECIEYCPEKPNDGKYKGEVCRGVWMQVTDRALADPIAGACSLLRAIHQQHGDQLTFRRPHLTLLLGSATLLDTILTAPGLRPVVADWEAACALFAVKRGPALLYAG